MGGVRLPDPLVAVALVARVAIAAVRVLSLRILVVSISDLAGARFSGVVAVRAPVPGRGADIVRVIRARVIRALPCRRVWSGVGGPQVGVARVGIAAGVTGVCTRVAVASAVATAIAVDVSGMTAIALTARRISGEQCAGLKYYGQQSYDENRYEYTGAVLALLFPHGVHRSSSPRSTCCRNQLAAVKHDLRRDNPPRTL